LAPKPAHATLPYTEFAIPNGDIYQSDPWGQAADTGGTQSIYTNSTGFGATWDWAYGTLSYDSVKAYPSFLSGWQFGGTWPGSSANGFPVNVGTHPNLPAKWTYTLTGDNVAYDADFDVFVAATPTSDYPSGEIMVWLNFSGLTPINNEGQTGSGQVIKDVNGNAAPGTYTVYWGTTNDGNGHTWPVWSFVRDAAYRSATWNSNLAPFVNNVAVNNTWLWSDYVMDIQGGIEIANSNNQTGGVFTTWGNFWGSAN
jgi:hypothetical protein